MLGRNPEFAFYWWLICCIQILNMSPWNCDLSIFLKRVAGGGRKHHMLFNFQLNMFFLCSFVSDEPLLLLDEIERECVCVCVGVEALKTMWLSASDRWASSYSSYYLNVAPKMFSPGGCVVSMGLHAAIPAPGAAGRYSADVTITAPSLMHLLAFNVVSMHGGRRPYGIPLTKRLMSSYISCFFKTVCLHTFEIIIWWIFRSIWTCWPWETAVCVDFNSLSD